MCDAPHHARPAPEVLWVAAITLVVQLPGCSTAQHSMEAHGRAEGMGEMQWLTDLS